MGDKEVEAKDATHHHDSINVVLIAGLCALTVATYAAADVAADSAAQRDNVVLVHPLHGWLTCSALVYTLFDLAFIIVVPSCTKRFGQLFMHHVATIFLVYLGLQTTSCSMTVKCMLVEINTLLLTVMKHYRIKVLMVPMLISWFLLRLVWYPMLTMEVSHYFSAPRFEVWVWPLAMSCFVVLNCLNVFWSYEFVRPKRGGASTPGTTKAVKNKEGASIPKEASKNGDLKHKGA